VGAKVHLLIRAISANRERVFRAVVKCCAALLTLASGQGELPGRSMERAFSLSNEMKHCKVACIHLV
jgi:hypothetical protein